MSDGGTRSVFVAVAADDELGEGQMGSYAVDGAEILLVNAAGEYFAYRGRCPDQGCHLVDGHLEGTQLTCPSHDFGFDVLTGKVVNRGDSYLLRFAVRVAYGQVAVNPHLRPSADRSSIGRTRRFAELIGQVERTDAAPTDAPA